MQPRVSLVSYYEGCSINKLQNGIILLIFKVWKDQNIGFMCYLDHLRLIVKHVGDFLLVLIDLFFTRSYSWGATSDYWFKIGDFAPTGAGWPKISGRRVAPTNHSSSQKTRLNDLSHGIKIWTDFFPLCHNAPVWQKDRQNSHRKTASAFHAAQ